MAQKQMTSMKIADVPAFIEDRTGWLPCLDTIRDWARTGKITTKKIGGRVFVEIGSLDQMIGKEEDHAVQA